MPPPSKLKVYDEEMDEESRGKLSLQDEFEEGGSETREAEHFDALASSNDEGQENDDVGLLEHTSSLLSKNVKAPSKLSMSRSAYDVVFTKGPIGLELETDWYGRHVVVKAFKKVNGVDGPAKQSGKVHVGDVLTRINERSCLELTFQETMQQLRQVSSEPHTLRFSPLEALGDLTRFHIDKDIREAKQYIHDHKESMYHPISDHTEGLLLGCIERHRGPEISALHLHREDNGSFLLACSFLDDGSGTHVFHTLRDSHFRGMRDLPQGEDSAAFLGSMTPNFLGTEFQVLDHRGNEIALILYDTNVFGQTPNAFKVILPREISRQDEGRGIRERFTYRQLSRNLQSPLGSSFLGRLRSWSSEKSVANDSSSISIDYGAVEQVDCPDLLLLKTKQPKWNKKLNGWTLKFEGRAKVSSKKNFVLGCERGSTSVEAEYDEDEALLRFGKMSKVRFALDFKAPLSSIVALAIASSSFSRKKLVT